MHINRLIISSCMQNVHSARSPSKKMNNDRHEEEENLPEVTVLGGVAVAAAVKPSDSSGASSSLCRDTSRCLLPPLVYLFYPFFPSPRLFLSVSLSISSVFGFYCFGRFSLNTIGLSLSLSLGFPPRFLSFLPLLFLPFKSLFIEAGEAGSTLPRPIAAHTWGARRLLCHGADSGGQWRHRLRGTAALASHHEMGGV